MFPVSLNLVGHCDLSAHSMCYIQSCTALHLSGWRYLSGVQFLCSGYFYMCKKSHVFSHFAPQASLLDKLQLMQTMLSDLSPSSQQKNSWFITYTGIFSEQADEWMNVFKHCTCICFYKWGNYIAACTSHWDTLVSSSLPMILLLWLLACQILACCGFIWVLVPWHKINDSCMIKQLPNVFLLLVVLE